MVTEKTIERINELYHKSKAEGLTDAELAEQKQLRADYVKAFREDWQRNRHRKATRWIRMKFASLLRLTGRS